MQKINRFSSVAFVAAALALGACGSDGDKSLGTDNPADMTLSLEDFAANWDGYIEAYDLPSGSDRIRIVLDEQGEGTVLFGDGDVLPPPTDPDAAYPPQEESIDYMKGLAEAVYEQIAYPVYETRLEASRLRLELHSSDAVADWCALQTPVYDEANDRYSCVPNTGGGMDENGCWYNGPNDEHIAVSCAKLSCTMSCACTETSCSAVDNGVVKLDGALDDDGQTLEGTLVLNGTPRTIRLTRQ